MIDRDMLYEQIGAKIRKYRKDSGLNQEELAQKVDLNRSSIAQIETGKQAVSIHTLYSMAELLQRKISDFLLPDDFDSYSIKRIKERDTVKDFIDKYGEENND
jgi:transcriptional regulator with XRE-family HTH domain